MHELGVLMQVVDMVERTAEENEIEKVEKIVLQVGELASVVPKYLEACYEPAVYNTSLQDTELEIEIIPGNCKCADCGHVFNFLKSNRKCPECGGDQLILMSGREFYIKEIIGL